MIIAKKREYDSIHFPSLMIADNGLIVLMRSPGIGTIVFAAGNYDLGDRYDETDPEMAKMYAKRDLRPFSGTITLRNDWGANHA